jgi:alpha-beta hydrolase superfamily lysophospholipase
MWLRDWLPTQLTGSRSIIYGYDSKLEGSESFQNMDEIVLRFIQLLETISPSFSRDRPIVLFAHSMGGIILKHALVKMQEKGSPTQKEILHQIRGVILFGVPNQGMEISHFLAMVDGRPNENLVRALRRDSPYLQELDHSFYNVATARRIRLISVYETRRSRRMQVR